MLEIGKQYKIIHSHCIVRITNITDFNICYSFNDNEKNKEYVTSNISQFRNYFAKPPDYLIKE